MNRLSSLYRSTSRGAQGPSPPETIPFNFFAFPDGLHPFFVDPLRFLRLAFRPDFAHGPQDTGTAADSICAGLGLGFFLFGYRSHLIQVAFEYRCVWYVFG